MAFNYYGFFDGASKGNPGKAGCGALLKDSKGTTIWQIAYPIGIKTNNEAEYSAIILLLIKIQIGNYSNVLICGDSKLVVEQMKGNWKVDSDKLKPFYKKAMGLLSRLKDVYIKWVPREENSEADKLSNMALNGEVYSDQHKDF